MQYFFKLSVVSLRRLSFIKSESFLFLLFFIIYYFTGKQVVTVEHISFRISNIVTSSITFVTCITLIDNIFAMYFIEYEITILLFHNLQ